MNARRNVTVASLTITALPFVSRCADATAASDPAPQQLIEEVRALRSEVAELKARQSATQRGAASTQKEDSKPSIGLVLDRLENDTAAHSRLLDESDFTAGYVKNQGFLIRSEDGNFLLHPWAFIQVRDALNYRENGKNGTESDTENGIELPRMKFILDGNVISPDLTYQFIWATSDTTGNLGLQDAWARYHIPGTPLAVRGGQIRDPLDHEQILYATRSLTPERSIVNNLLLNADGIVKGISLGYGYDAPSPLRSEVAFTGGERSLDTTFQTFPVNQADWGAAGRVEWKLTGDWKDYAQFTALNDREPLLVLGAGADYTEAGSTRQLIHLVDAQYDLPSGLSLYAAYLGRYTRRNAAPPGTNGRVPGATAAATAPLPYADTYDASVRLVAAYLIDRHWEPFIRYEYLHLDSRELPAGTAHDVIHDITLGFNYYIYGHRAKFTAGASFLPNGSPISNAASDLLANHGGNEFIFQGQFQLIL